MIYADHNATSPLLTQVQTYLKKRLASDAIYANPNSLHSLGAQVHRVMEKSRSFIAKSLGASEDQVIFNSGSSEGISHVFQSVLTQARDTIVISNQEHAAVVQAANHYEKNGYKVIKIDSQNSGVIDFEQLEQVIKFHHQNIAIVSIIAANNETGVIQPYKEIGELCQENGIVYFPDTTQMIGKLDFNFNELPFDYAVISGHKLGSMTGVGALLVKDHTLLKPMIFGGAQENNKRSGTQHYIGIETLALALNESLKNMNQQNELEKARDQFEAELKKSFDELVIFGEESKRLAGTSLLGLKGIHGQAVQLELESHNIFVTTSSACADNEPETSQVLKSMGISDDQGRAAIRISLKLGQNPGDFKVIGEKLAGIFEKLSKIEY